MHVTEMMMYDCSLNIIYFLADHTIVIIVCLSVTLHIVAKRYILQQVSEQCVEEVYCWEYFQSPTLILNPQTHHPQNFTELNYSLLLDLIKL